MDVPLERRTIILRATQDLRLRNSEYDYVDLKADKPIRCTPTEACMFLVQSPVNKKAGASYLKIESPLPIWPGSMVWWEESSHLVGPGLVIGVATDHDDLRWYLINYNGKGYLLHARQIVEHHPHNIVCAMVDVLMAEASSEKQKGIIRGFLDQFTGNLDEHGSEGAFSSGEASL
ncbi:MAG: hypothetical protein H8K08_07195 [Nitrospira sp.]|nr:hypothetical protein [Nitrospira sp.]